MTTARPLTDLELENVRKFLAQDPVPRELSEKAWAQSARELLATLDSRPSGGWLDIEGAPKDGTTIIVGRRCSIYGFVRGYAYWTGGDSVVSGWISHGFTEPPGNLGLAAPEVYIPLPSPPVK